MHLATTVKGRRAHPSGLSFLTWDGRGRRGQGRVVPGHGSRTLFFQECFFKIALVQMRRELIGCVGQGGWSLQTQGQGSRSIFVGLTF